MPQSGQHISPLCAVLRRHRGKDTATERAAAARLWYLRRRGGKSVGGGEATQTVGGQVIDFELYVALLARAAESALTARASEGTRGLLLQGTGPWQIEAARTNC